MTMLRVNNIIKGYMRFLKDEGIFYRAMSIHGSRCDWYNRQKILHNSDYVFNDKPLIRCAIKSLRDRIDIPGQFISDCRTFCDWSQTKEGRGYWYSKSVLWRWYLVKELHDKSDMYSFEHHIREILEDYSDAIPKDTLLKLNSILKEIG